MWNLVDSIFPRPKETEVVKAWSHVTVPMQKFMCFLHIKHFPVSGFQLLIQPYIPLR